MHKPQKIKGNFRKVNYRKERVELPAMEEAFLPKAYAINKDDIMPHVNNP